MHACLRVHKVRQTCDGVAVEAEYRVLTVPYFLPKLEALCGSRMADHGLLEAVRGLWLADPGLAPKPLLAKLREQQPDLGAGTREVREALLVLNAESEAKEATAAPPADAAPPAAAAAPSADEGGAPMPASLAPSLACFGCARLPNDGLANAMRALVLRSGCGTWLAGPRSAAELKEAATHYERAAALHPAPAMQAQLAEKAAWCHSLVSQWQSDVV